MYKKKNFGAAAKKKNNNETFRTYGSRVVPHLSTRQAQRCLTSEFRWDLVFPPWYDRMSIHRFDTHIVHNNICALKKKNFIAIRGFDPRTFGLWAQRATAAPNRFKIYATIIAMKKKFFFSAKFFIRCELAVIYNAMYRVCVYWRLSPPFFIRWWSLARSLPFFIRRGIFLKKKIFYPLRRLAMLARGIFYPLSHQCRSLPFFIRCGQ